MSFASNFIICIDGCKSRTRRSSQAVVCEFDGIDIVKHALEGRCADPKGSRYEKVFVSLRGKVVEGTARDSVALDAEPNVLGEICQSLLKRAEARAARLQPICEGCPDMLKIGRRDQPLRIDVLCRKEKCCGSEGPGLVSLIYGRCPVGKHNDELAKLKCEGGGACR